MGVSEVKRLFRRHAFKREYNIKMYINLLATDFFFQILAHPVFKM